MLAAMSSGGRIGLDAPYMPRGCDMRWFTSEEVCEIIGRFNRVIVVGDSMMRHVVGSINILIRKDIGYGAVTNWNFSEQEKWEILHPFRVFDDADCLTGDSVSAMNNLMSRPVLFKAFTKP
jgi:hypothetical protein